MKSGAGVYNHTGLNKRIKRKERCVKRNLICDGTKLMVSIVLIKILEGLIRFIDRIKRKGVG